MTFDLPDAASMRGFGASIAAAVLAADEPGPLLVTLRGELGAGKTTLVGGLLAALGHDGPVRSPTYTLVEPYRLAGRDILHCDLYRLRDPDELEDLGLRDLLVPRALLLVEWPEKAGGRLGTVDLALGLEYAGECRRVRVEAGSEAGSRVLAMLPSPLT